MTAGIDDQKLCAKLLSILILARDDNYMHDFEYRITTTINYLARNVKRLERLDDVEILVVDWGSETPMSKTLPLSPEAGQITRFVYVPAEVIKQVQTREEDFNVSIAWNVAVRRTRCQFTMVYAADTLMTEHSLDTLFRLLEGRLNVSISVDQTYFLCCRYQVPWKFVASRPDLDQWDRLFLLNTHDFPGESTALLGVSKGAGSLLMHRSLMEELHGADESLEQYGWGDMEFGLRITRRYPWIELSAFGIALYHMEHASFGKRVSVISKDTNPPVIHPGFRVNDEKWGLVDYDFEIQTAENVRLGQKEQKRRTSTSHFEQWGQTKKDVLIELNSDIVRAHVRLTAERFWTYRYGWKIENNDIDALFFITWYSIFHHPYKYLEFGIDHGYMAGAVGGACPGSEIYGIDHWEGLTEPCTPVAISMVLKRICGHCGYVRFVNGEVKTAIKRLKKTFIGPFSFDLVLVRGEMLGKDLADQVCALLSHLSEGGGLVFSCYSSDLFATTWTQLRDQFPKFAYFQSGGNTGLILKVSFVKDDGSEEMDGALNLTFQKKYLWVSMIKCKVISFIRKLRRLMSFRNILKSILPMVVVVWYKTRISEQK